MSGLLIAAFILGGFALGVLATIGVILAWIWLVAGP